MTKTKIQSIGRFNYKFKFNTDESTYFVFNKKDYKLMTDLLERGSVKKSFNRSLSKINFPKPSTKYDKNKTIFEIYTKGKDCKLYHIKDCTVQIFIDFPLNKDLAGIFIVNLNKNKRQKAIEKLEEIFA